MQIINARTNQLQAIPFSLGEAGRGRKLERVDLNNRPGQAPSGPEDVSYFTFGVGGSQHCILTSSAVHGAPKVGVLVRIDTNGTYTRGSSGSVTLCGGQATLLARGEWASGDAGRLGGGPDDLWHVSGPSLFEVVIGGGAQKGFGRRYLVVTRDLRVTFHKPDALCQLIATDDDPAVSAVVREHLGGVPEERRQRLADALALADQLEQAEPASMVEVSHFVEGAVLDEKALKPFGVAVPTAMLPLIGGVGGITADTLVPGSQALAVLGVGPCGGGKRYGYRVEERAGVEVLRRLEGRGSEALLLLVTDAAWRLRWTESKDGATTSLVVADAGGVHHYECDFGRSWTTPWAGREPVPMGADQIRKLFDAAQ